MVTAGGGVGLLRGTGTGITGSAMTMRGVGSGGVLPSSGAT